MTEVSQLVKKLEKECNGTLSFVDILFNHVSPDCELLIKIPEAIYNEKTAPHLTVAIELDKALTEFSKRFANKEFIEEYPKGNLIENEHDLNHVMDLVRRHVFEKEKYAEFFLFDMEEMKKQFKDALDKANL